MEGTVQAEDGWEEHGGAIRTQCGLSDWQGVGV